MAAFALPLKLNILVAIAAAVAAGLLMEAVEQQRQRHQKILKTPLNPWRLLATISRPPGGMRAHERGHHGGLAGDSGLALITVLARAFS